MTALRLREPHTLTPSPSPAYQRGVSRSRMSKVAGSRLLALLVVGTFATLASSPRDASATAAEDADRARKAVVVLKVGGAVVTVGELEDRLAAVPRFQLVDFGKTPAEIRLGFLERIVIPELLLAEGARSEGVSTKLPWSNEIARAKSGAALRAVRATVPSGAQITPEEVKAYYEANLSFYDSPERVHVFRILVATEPEATALVTTLKKDLTLKAFTELAREKSLDKATNMRGGNLGFLGPDGASNEAGLKADPALVTAAKTVKDGELCPKPVPEGTSFAVVWRRGTVAATKRTLDDATPQIRDTLSRRKLEEATKRHIEELKATQVKDRDDGPLSVFNVHIDDGPMTKKADAGKKP